MFSSCFFVGPHYNELNAFFVFILAKSLSFLLIFDNLSFWEHSVALYIQHNFLLFTVTLLSHYPILHIPLLLQLSFFVLIIFFSVIHLVFSCLSLRQNFLISSFSYWNVLLIFYLLYCHFHLDVYLFFCFIVTILIADSVQ